MNQIITITLNPAFDIHYYVPDFKSEQENYSTARTVDVGGKGINISKALEINGVSNLALITAGKDNFQEFSVLLEKDNVKFESIICDGAIRYNVTIHPKNGLETRVSQDSFQITPDTLNEVKERLTNLVTPGTVIAFSGRIPKGIQRDAVKNLLHLLKNLGALLILDTNSLNLNDIIEIKPWLIKPNIQEIESLMGKKLLNHMELLEITTALHKKGVSNVLVSLGEHGLIYTGHQSSYRIEVPKITPISTVGAGDSTLAGYIYGHSNKRSQKEILKIAAAFGVAKCLEQGTKPPIPKNIASIYENVSISCIKK